jgi:hypothetical protein
MMSEINIDFNCSDENGSAPFVVQFYAVVSDKSILFDDGSIVFDDSSFTIG